MVRKLFGLPAFCFLREGQSKADHVDPFLQQVPVHGVLLGWSGTMCSSVSKGVFTPTQKAVRQKGILRQEATPVVARAHNCPHARPPSLPVDNPVGLAAAPRSQKPRRENIAASWQKQRTASKPAMREPNAACA